MSSFDGIASSSFMAAPGGGFYVVDITAAESAAAAKVKAGIGTGNANYGFTQPGKLDESNFVTFSNASDITPAAIASVKAQYARLGRPVPEIMTGDELERRRSVNPPVYYYTIVDIVNALRAGLSADRIISIITGDSIPPSPAFGKAPLPKSPQTFKTVTSAVDPKSYGPPSLAILAERQAAALLPEPPSTFWKDTGAAGGDFNPGPIAPASYVANRVEPARVVDIVVPSSVLPTSTRSEGSPWERPLGPLTVGVTDNASVPMPVAVLATTTMNAAAAGSSGATTLAAIGKADKTVSAAPTAGPEPKSNPGILLLALGVGVVLMLLMRGMK